MPEGDKLIDEREWSVPGGAPNFTTSDESPFIHNLKGGGEAGQNTEQTEKRGKRQHGKGPTV